MAATKTKEPKKKIVEEEIEEEDELEEEEEEEEEEEKPKPKKKTAAQREDTPAWAKQIIKILTGTEQPPAAQTIPTPKPPAAPKVKEDEDDLENPSNPQPNEKPRQTFLGWFW